MAYRQVYFRIHTKGYSSGWTSNADRSAFKEESRRLFQELGWTIKLGHNVGCDVVTKDRQDLYLHPTSFSGVMEETNIQPLQEQLLNAQAFRCYHVDRYEEYQDLSDEEYRAALEAKRDEITAYILEQCKTKRRNLYIVAPVAGDVAAKFEICRLCDKDRRNNFTIKKGDSSMEQRKNLCAQVPLSLYKLVYICAPLRGDVEKNIAFARQKTQEVFQAGDIPICSQLMFPPSSSQSPLVSVSAYGENSAHSLAPPLPAKPASLGFGWSPENPAQDQAAREMGLRLVESCQEVHVYGPEWTDGMWAEIRRAMDRKIPVLTDQKTIGRSPPRRQVPQKGKGAR